jgi:hypothetical protein
MRGCKEGIKTEMMNCVGWGYQMMSAQWYWSNPMRWIHWRRE